MQEIPTNVEESGHALCSPLTACLVELPYPKHQHHYKYPANHKVVSIIQSRYDADGNVQ